MAQAAQLEGCDPATFAHHWRLTDAGLLRRLIRLEHLVSARGVLLDLLAGVRAQNEPGLALYTWQVWPLHWSYRWRDTQRPLPLDGAAALSRPTADGLRWSSFVLLYDGLPMSPVTPRGPACAPCGLPVAHSGHRRSLPHRAPGHPAERAEGLGDVSQK